MNFIIAQVLGIIAGLLSAIAIQAKSKKSIYGQWDVVYVHRVSLISTKKLNKI